METHTHQNHLIDFKLSGYITGCLVSYRDVRLYNWTKVVHPCGTYPPAAHKLHLSTTLVCMYVCVPTPRTLINSGIIWCDVDPISSTEY